MKHQKYQKLFYRIRHDWLTTNNVVIAVAGFVAISWAWGSVNVLERNYLLQQEIDDKNRLLKLSQLQVETERYQQSYYKSTEYQELAARQRLGLVKSGEHVVIMPENTEAASSLDERSQEKRQPSLPPTNVEQWTNFLFGNSSANTP